MDYLKFDILDIPLNYCKMNDIFLNLAKLIYIAEFLKAQGYGLSYSIYTKWYVLLISTQEDHKSP